MNRRDLPVSMAEVRFSLLDLARVIEMALLPNFASFSGGGDEINEKQPFFTRNKEKNLTGNGVCIPAFFVNREN